MVEVLAAAIGKDAGLLTPPGSRVALRAVLLGESQTLRRCCSAADWLLDVSPANHSSAARLRGTAQSVKLLDSRVADRHKYYGKHRVHRAPRPMRGHVSSAFSDARSSKKVVKVWVWMNSQGLRGLLWKTSNLIHLGRCHGTRLDGLQSYCTRRSRQSAA